MKPSPHAHATLISCPGCAGVISIVPEDGVSHLHLVCCVGHSYSLQTLMQAKEDDLEKLLWSAAALLEHVEMINGLMLKEIDKLHLRIDKQGLEKRIEQARSQGQRIRQMIEESETPDLEQSASEHKR